MLRNLAGLVPKLGLYVAGFGILAMVSLIFAEIVATKLFNTSLPYVLEYSEYLVPIIVFWGAAYTLAEHGHVRADILVHRFPEPLRSWILLAGYVLGLVFLIVVFRHLANVAWISWVMNRQSFYPTPSPLGPPQMFACAGLGLFIVQLVIEIARMARDLLRGGRPDPQP
jgi:TRAP-type C4-dicarboxylate transport system permease small subunit